MIIIIIIIVIIIGYNGKILQCISNINQLNGAEVQ